MIGKLKDWARAIKRDVHAIYLVARDPGVPWYAKAVALCVAGYALSPIDLIPDFIPVFGYLDDLIIVPLGILVIVSVTCRAANRRFGRTSTSGVGGGKGVTVR